MTWTIRQTATGWEVLRAGVVVTLPDGAAEVATYDKALAFIATQLAAPLADEGATTADGLLPESWEDVNGICFSTETPDGRDFTGCTWLARDPSVSLMPLMLQTETDMGHFGAELAGFFETITGLGPGATPRATGRFYDSDRGREMRDMLLGGRVFGVSVDPGPGTEMVWECIEEDEDGWCIEDKITFTAYEVIGLTATPFPAWPEAAIRLATAETVAAGATTLPRAGRISEIPLYPPAEWFEMAEPELGSDLLVEQEDGGFAVPLTITDDGSWFGHLARWGQCHVGYQGQCVTPPESQAAYFDFHVGERRTAEGTSLATGAMTAGCDHALASLRAAEARDHYAHNGRAWADGRVMNGQWGPWASGALRPDVTEAQIVALRAGALSGDWRDRGHGLELIAALACNEPGFPIAREALRASGFGEFPTPRVHGAMAGGRQISLVASGIVRRCPECSKRAQASLGRVNGASQLGPADKALLNRLASTLEKVERRTRHLSSTQAEAFAARIRARG